MGFGAHRDNTLVVVEDNHGRRASFSIDEFRQLNVQVDAILADIDKDTKRKAANAETHGLAATRPNEKPAKVEVGHKPVSATTSHAHTK